jgi:hypothetical protein
MYILGLTPSATLECEGGHCSGLGATLWESVAFDWIDQALCYTPV